MGLPHALNLLFGNLLIDNIQKLYHEFIVAFSGLHFALCLCKAHKYQIGWEFERDRDSGQRLDAAFCWLNLDYVELCGFDLILLKVYLENSGKLGVFVG